MTIPADIIIGQGQLLYRKQPNGAQPIVFTVMCNCSSSIKERTSRYISQNRHEYITPEQFTRGEWS
jgi:hypothetical protein